MSLDVELVKKCTCGEAIAEHYYEANITHNLAIMAGKAGIYKAIWRPHEIDCKFAKDILPIVEKGYEDMLMRPDYYNQFNAENGWGLYEDFMPWISDYIEAMRENPDSEIITCV